MIDLQEPRQTGFDYMYFDARGRIDISYYLEGTGYIYRPGVKEELDGAYETDLKDAVTAALEYSGVYPDEVEQDYSNPEQFYFEIRNDGYSYTLESFENFLGDMKRADDNLGNKEGFAEDLINSLEDDEVDYLYDDEEIDGSTDGYVDRGIDRDVSIIFVNNNEKNVIYHVENESKETYYPEQLKGFASYLEKTGDKEWAKKVYEKAEEKPDDETTE